jgi:arylsulfatase A-like enzyme
VGAYGYPQARTPRFDALAREGTLFRQAVAHSYYTGPSHTSILTGLQTDRHGVRNNLMKLDEDVPEATDYFRARGYVTGAFVGGYPTTEGSSRLLSRFHYYDDDLREIRLLPRQADFVSLLALLHPWIQPLTPAEDALDRPAQAVVDSAIAWLAANRGSPFFVWVHLYDPHLPYRAPLPFLLEEDRGADGPVDGNWYSLSDAKRGEIASSEEHRRHMLRLYDAEIAYADHELGRLLDAARESPPAGHLVTIVTADHGEAMGEHGSYWGRDLYDETLLVPLVVAGPGVAPGQVVTAPVRLVDVMPTALELAGLPAPEAIDGRSLVPWILGREQGSPGPAVSSVYEKRPAVSVRSDGWKLIERSAGWSGPECCWEQPSTELYDLRGDPAELQSRASSEPAQLRALATLLPREAPQATEQILSREETARLRALGYVR